MTINTAPVIEYSDEDESTPNEIGYLPDTEVPEEVPPYTTPPIPGIDILNIVYEEVTNKAREVKESGEGNTPKYVLVRVDIYLIAMSINEARGLLHIVNKELDLDCYLIPHLPRGEQSPFIIGYSYDDVRGAQIASFKEGTFQYVTPEEPSPAECDAVETNNN